MAPPSIVDSNNFASAVPDEDTGRRLASAAGGAPESAPSWGLPQKQGLYDPANEHDACGVGFIVAIDGKRSHKVCVAYV